MNNLKKEAMQEEIIDKCYEQSIMVLKKCSTSHGLFASAGKKGYNAVWARDSMISMIGASSIPEFKKTFKQSLITLTKSQSKNGQIPNCVDKWSERKPHVDFQSIDSTLWYIIGHYNYMKAYKDASLFNKYKENIKKALNWLSCQDSGEIEMLTQQPTSDWQDAFPHRYGHTINTQALYYKLLILTKENIKAKKLKKNSNYDDDKKLWDENFYVSYRWKNHGKYKEIGNWFDSLGNLLAIIFNLADKEQSEKILRFIEENKIAYPSPIKCIYPPIKPNSKYWKDYYFDCESGIPNNYSNGGIWGYVGCFYVLALIKLKKFKQAEEQLKKIAEINLKNNFPEWVHPVSKKAYGEMQAWEAGAYILAYFSLKNKKIII